MVWKSTTNEEPARACISDKSHKIVCSVLSINPSTMDIEIFRGIPIVFTLCIHQALCYYGPHLFPSQGPFFEGWYIRIIDFSSNQSFGLLFGKVLPENAEELKNLAVVGALIDTNGHLKSYDEVLNPEDVSITIHGEEVKEDPGYMSPPDFEWVVPSRVSIKIRENRSTFRVRVAEIEFEGVIGSPLPWDEGLDYATKSLLKLILSSPLPLQWYLHSLGSEVSELKWTNTKTNFSYSMKPGAKILAHMEKNWGNSFPEASIWTQGIRPESGVSFALGYGPVNFGITNIHGHLMSYKNEEKSLVLTFLPLNSYATVTPSGCSRSLVADFTGLWHHLTLEVHAANETFSDCLLAPYQNGFVRSLKETYRATAQVWVWKRVWWGWEEVDNQVVEMSALEFNGKYVCEEECKAE